jgi:branched-chain amino acid transport system permease protein
MRRQTALLLACVALVLGAPFAVSDFWIFVFIEVLVFALYAVTFNLLLGYGGMLAFGHAVFFGIGAYSLAIMMKKAGLGAFAATVLSPLVAAAVGAAIAYFCVRLTGIYFGMLTFAFQMLVYTVVFKSYELTGGDDGLSGINAGGIAATPQGFYYVTLLVVAAAVWLLWRLVHSPFGLALRAQRSNDRKSLALGINTPLHKWLTFVIAAFFAGLAGALFALANQSVFPGWLNWTASATPIVMTILGGMHTFVGPIVGAVIYVLLQTLLTGLTEYWALFLGAAIILLVMLMPNGVTGLMRGRGHD